MKKLKVMLDKDAYMPIRAHRHDAGLDLFSTEDICLFEKSSVTIDTGVHVEIPKGYVGFIKSKSGLMVKHDIVTDGTVDVSIGRGMKIAQLVIVPIETPVCMEVYEMPDTERGTGGFGSTGK